MLIWAEDGISNPLNLMQTALARSSHHLLTIRFQYWPSYSYRCPHANEMFTLLTEQAHRWEILYFSIPPSAYHLLAPIRGRINCLWTLHLQHHYNIPARLSDPPPLTDIDVFELAENLEAVYLFNLPHASRVLLPWSWLVDFADSREHTTAAAGLNQHLLDMLEAGVNLKMMVVIHQPMHNESFPVNDEHVINTSLEELHACDGNFLCSITLPNLLSASLETQFGDRVRSSSSFCTSNALQGLRDMIIRSHCPLHSLYLSSIVTISFSSATPGEPSASYSTKAPYSRLPYPRLSIKVAYSKL